MFDKICEKLFGVGKENQEKLIIKLCVISVLMFFIAIILNIDGGVVLLFLVWGWRALCACIGITQIGKFFQSNIVIIIISVIAWLTLGMLAGIAVCIIGIARLVQLKIQRYKKQKESKR